RCDFFRSEPAHVAERILHLVPVMIGPFVCQGRKRVHMNLFSYAVEVIAYMFALEPGLSAIGYMLPGTSSAVRGMAARRRDPIGTLFKQFKQQGLGIAAFFAHDTGFDKVSGSG